MVRFIFLKCPKAHSVDVTMKLTALIWSFIRVDGTGTEIVEVFFLCIFQKFVHIFRSDKCDSSRFCWRFCAKELSVSALCLTYVFTKTVVLWNPNSLVIYSFIYLFKHVYFCQFFKHLTWFCQSHFHLNCVCTFL